MDRRTAWLALVLLSCDAGPSSIDAAQDDAAVTAVVFDAAADPTERTDCSGAVAAGSVIAKHITCAAELIDAPLAMGRIGDVVIANAYARFVIRTGSESASTIGGFAGGVVDAALVGGDDAIKEIFPLFDFGVARATDVVVTDSGATASGAMGAARVTVLFDVQPLGILAAAAPGLSRARPIHGAIEYLLTPGGTQLYVIVRYSTTPGTARAQITPGFAALLGGNGELQRPGFGLIPSGGGGTGVPAVISEGPTSALAIGLGSVTGSMLAVNTIHLLSGERVDVTEGAVTTTGATIGLSDTAADAWARVDPRIGLAATSDTVLVVTGTPGDRVRVASAAGEYLRTRLPSDGVARVMLPPGDYTATSGFGTFFPGASVDVSVDRFGSATDPLPLPSATLHVVASADGDASAPVRVTLRAPSSTDDVLRFVATGPTDVRIPPGTYVVDVSHGVEHDIHEESITVADGETRTVTAILNRAIDTTGYIGCDFHLHSDLSTDSLHHVLDAVRTVAAEGLDLVASTDHDYITDYAAMLARVGLSDRLVVIAGDEVSSTVLGHFGGYPLARDVDMAGAGAPIWFDASPVDIFDRIEARGDATLGGALVQLNHPRLRGTSFFDVIGLDTTTAHATASPARLDLPATTDLDDLSQVDVIEAWNGYTRGDNEAAFADFLALWDTGRRFTMVGNSDSHRAELPAGAPRTFLRVPHDAHGMFAWSDAAAALRAHDATVSAGIFVTASLAGPRDASDHVALHVHVEAAPWASTSRLRIYAGREVVLDMPLTTGANVRFDGTIDVPLGGARFVVVRADGDRDAEPVFPFHPFGVTNPIEVP